MDIAIVYLLVFLAGSVITVYALCRFGQWPSRNLDWGAAIGLAPLIFTFICTSFPASNKPGNYAGLAGMLAVILVTLFIPETQRMRTPLAVLLSLWGIVLMVFHFNATASPSVRVLEAPGAPKYIGGMPFSPLSVEAQLNMEVEYRRRQEQDIIEQISVSGGNNAAYPAQWVRDLPPLKHLEPLLPKSYYRYRYIRPIHHWHSPLTQMYGWQLITEELWYPGGRLQEALGQVTFRTVSP